MDKTTARKPGDRPFPWLCSNCLKREVYPETVAYAAEVKHDGVMHTVPLSSLETPQCRSCGQLFFSDHADEQINDALRTQLRLLTPLQIRQRRMDLNLSERELAEKLGVAEAMVGRWEGGLVLHSRAMDNLLRVFFDLPEVRAVLLGKNQDPLLGTGLARSA